MATFEVKLESKQFDLYLKNIKRNVKRRDAILITARKVSAESTAKRFRDGGSPPYNWPALAESTIKQRIAEGTWPGAGGSQPILQRFGKLEEAVTDVSGTKEGSFFRRLGLDTIEFGTDFVGAQSLNVGDMGRNLPARPFHYWSVEDVSKIESFALSLVFGGKASIPRGLLA